MDFRGTLLEIHYTYLYIWREDWLGFHLLCQYVTQTVEVESPATVKQLTKARQRNEVLTERLSSQNERCKQLEEHIRKSDEYSCNLQHKVTSRAAQSSKLTQSSIKSYFSNVLFKYAYIQKSHFFKSRYILIFICQEGEIFSKLNQIDRWKGVV